MRGPAEGVQQQMHRVLGAWPKPTSGHMMRSTARRRCACIWACRRRCQVVLAATHGRLAAATNRNVLTRAAKRGMAKARQGEGTQNKAVARAGSAWHSHRHLNSAIAPPCMRQTTHRDSCDAGEGHNREGCEQRPPHRVCVPSDVVGTRQGEREQRCEPEP